jgi:hypothetical protein
MTNNLVLEIDSNGTGANTPQYAMPAISKCSTIKFLWAENKCYALSLYLTGTASAVRPLAVMPVTQAIQVASP